jgi:hypothetical protein
LLGSPIAACCSGACTPVRGHVRQWRYRRLDDDSEHVLSVVLPEHRLQLVPDTVGDLAGELRYQRRRHFEHGLIGIRPPVVAGDRMEVPTVTPQRQLGRLHEALRELVTRLTEQVMRLSQHEVELVNRVVIKAHDHQTLTQARRNSRHTAGGWNRANHLRLREHHQIPPRAAQWRQGGIVVLVPLW